jgi:hypothetical protein
LQHYNYLTGVHGYQHVGKDSSYETFSSAVNEIQQLPLSVNTDALFSIVMKNYPLSDDTVVKQLKRVSWMKGNAASLPMHDKKVLPAEVIAVKLNILLLDEIRGFVAGKSSVGILLSGGMDSRIVASVLKQLQVNGEYTGTVTALTWGLEKSRDVQYSARIAELYKWNFKHFNLTADILQKNIEVTASMGAEFSPVHLHAMPQIAELNGLDCILAGSYGDSIGRGEYSGRKVNAVPFLLDSHLNQFGLLKPKIEREGLVNLKATIESERTRLPGRSEIAYREIEMQLHYMRRQLNSCMAIIDAKTPIYQAFTSPEVFGFMWSLAPECRNDDVYDHLLQQCDKALLNIPWARTGKRYNKPGASDQDNFTSIHNSYGKWLRNDCRAFILGCIRNGSLQSLNVFDDKMLEHWCLHWSTSTSPKADRLDEKMAWLASLAIAIEKYNITGIEVDSENHSWIKRIKALIIYKAYRIALRYK